MDEQGKTLKQEKKDFAKQKRYVDDLENSLEEITKKKTLPF
jgi:hypothetical protein